MKRLSVLALLLLWDGRARAGALLKPTTGTTQALRAKSLDVSAAISGAFAQTTVTTIYANPNPERTEADFIYSAPPGAVVTGFAYWYAGEKVVARVVEKERAAQIYQYITSRMRDPALIEMIGPNTFRARIFPVEARVDLKIEVRFAQTLQPTRNGWAWSYALRDETREGPLDHFSLQVLAAGGASSNLGAFQGSRLSIKRQGFDARQDARVEVGGAGNSFVSARDGGSDGFFALALRAGATGSAAKASKGTKGRASGGGGAYDVVEAPGQKGGARFVFGRLRGRGQAWISDSGRRVPVSAGGAVEKGNVASLLWAAHRIQSMSASESNHEAVVALSKRFGMPSKWTSWLAIPEAERANFKEQILASDREAAARGYAQAIARGDRQAAARYKAHAEKVTAQLKALGESYSSREEQQPLSQYLNQELQNVRKSQARARLSGAKPAQAAQWKIWERNLRRAGAKDGAPGVEMPVYLVEDELRVASRLWAAEVEAGRPDGARARELRARLKELGGTKIARSYGWNADSFVQEGVQARMSDLALQIAVDRLSTRPNPALQARQQKSIERLAKRFGGDAKSTIRSAVATAARPRAERLALDVVVGEARHEPVRGRAELDRLATLAGTSSNDLLRAARTERERQAYNSATDELASQVLAGREESSSARGLKARVEKFAANSNDWWQKDAIKRAYNGRSHALAYEIEKERAKGTPDSARLARLEARLSETAPLGGNTPQSFEAWQKRRVAENQGPENLENYRFRVAGLDPNNFRGGYGGGDPLIRVDAPEGTRSIVAIMPSGEVKPLEWRSETKKWEANFDIPMGTRGDSYFVTVVIVDKDGLRHTLRLRYRVDAEAPTGSAALQGTVNGAKMLEVSASDDVARVIALLPWNERLTLRRGQDGAFQTPVQVPADWSQPSVPIRIILLDQAHNRTEFEIDWSEQHAIK